MNIEKMSEHELHDYAAFLVGEIERISYEYEERLPELKHLIKVVGKEMGNRSGKIHS